jgi:arsenate reductase (glutaredoxin)
MTCPGVWETAMTVTIYGIKNCDSMKKAFGWLKDHGVAYVFHDYKQMGIDEKRLRSWCDAAGLDKILNRAGTTFRQLGDADKADIDLKKALRLMQAQPSLIKRPVLELADRILVGFTPENYAEAFEK